MHVFDSKKSYGGFSKRAFGLFFKDLEKYGNATISCPLKKVQ